MPPCLRVILLSSVLTAELCSSRNCFVRWALYIAASISTSDFSVIVFLLNSTILIGTTASLVCIPLPLRKSPLPLCSTRHSCHLHCVSSYFLVTIGSSLACPLSLPCTVLPCVLWRRLERTPLSFWIIFCMKNTKEIPLWPDILSSL